MPIIKYMEMMMKIDNEYQLNRYKKMSKVLGWIVIFEFVCLLVYIFVSIWQLDDCVKANKELQQKILDSEAEHQKNYKELLRKLGE